MIRDTPIFVHTGLVVHLRMHAISLLFLQIYVIDVCVRQLCVLIYVMLKNNNVFVCCLQQNVVCTVLNVAGGRARKAALRCLYVLPCHVLRKEK